MEPLYIFKLPRAVDGQTYVGVTEEIRDGNQTNITGIYGKLTAAAVWKPADHMLPYKRSISGEDRLDLIEVANTAGRPSTLSDHEIPSSDLALWLAEDPTAQQTRIEARRPVVVEETGSVVV